MSVSVLALAALKAWGRDWDEGVELVAVPAVAAAFAAAELAAARKELFWA